MSLTSELFEVLASKGARLMKAGSMESVEACKYPVGVSVAVPLPTHMIRTLTDAPNLEYIEVYNNLNKQLNEIVLAGEEFLKSKGYDAFANTTDKVKTDEDDNSLIPHKTVATRAGLGWIGKNCLLVTEECGSAIRISSLFTDAPLELSSPIDQSKCGGCKICVKACPGHALKNTLWNSKMKRDEIVDKEVCHKKEMEIMKAATGIEDDYCGKCFAVCRYTKYYLMSIT